MFRESPHTGNKNCPIINYDHENHLPSVNENKNNTLIHVSLSYQTEKEICMSKDEFIE